MSEIPCGGRGSAGTQRVLAATLAAALLLAGCGRDLPAGPQAAPGGPLLDLNPACSPGGEHHSQGMVIAPVTWTRAAGPHVVDGLVTVYGAGRLRIEPGTVVCFGSDGSLAAEAGGRITARGLDTAVIVLTELDAGGGWPGVALSGTPDSASVFTHVRLEHALTALAAQDHHAVTVDSAVIRQSGQAASLYAPGSRLSRSRVDTTLTSGVPAVALGDSTRFEQTVVRGAAGVGVRVDGDAGLRLLGGRIEGSAGTGLQVTTSGGIVAADPLRVTGGAGYGADLTVDAFSRIYTALADQDSLLGNARDTLLMAGGVLNGFAYARQVLPWRVRADIDVLQHGVLRVQPGGIVRFHPGSGVRAADGGRVLARGASGYPALLTAVAPDSGWDGITLEGTQALGSKLTNARIEHVTGTFAVYATDDHPVSIDSTVIRQTWVAAWLVAQGSSIRRTRVDTTLSAYPAVGLGVSTTMESTRVRGSGGDGIVVGHASAQILSCDVSGSAGDGIELVGEAPVTGCNLAGNGGYGINSTASATADAEDNWWGDAAGPTGAGGDGVAGLVDYTPWRTTPAVMPYVP